MTPDKLYIQLLDGTTAWVPVKVKELDTGTFQILDDKEFTDYEDPNFIFEFYPGDIVETETKTFSDERTGLIASKLVKAGQWPDRKLRDFKFRSTTGTLTINSTTADFFKEEIQKIKADHQTGQFYYPNIIATINKLEEIKSG